MTLIMSQTFELYVSKDEYYEKRIVNIFGKRYVVTESQKDGTLNVWVKEMK